MRTHLPFALVTTLATVCSSMEVAAESINEVILASEVEWEQLNPARGNKSPMAATLWGDRKGVVPTGFLAKFVDGFSSPPHIHNVTYRAVVISGGIHNDDPNAAAMWMPAGSFWTQPKGEVHITAAKGKNNVALVEIDKGPYLVLPVDKTFDSGERPINLDASNIVWVDPPGTSAASNGPKVAYLWGSQQDGQSNGTFIKLPTGFTGKIQSTGSTFRAVVIKGQSQYQVSETEVKRLEPGSYFSSMGSSIHIVSSISEEESILYIHTIGSYEIMSN
ncbi:MAG: hypothetical protein B6D74_17520 [gamma proteobacterium symbiont of Ctena orbiculata]|nr:MAG: hypothetical protein B6D74_17520 [gamma proteobacterium symbiont of Ctena orbiculata]